MVEAEGAVPYETVAIRAHYGWPLEKALKKPILKQSPKKPIKTNYKGKTYTLWPTSSQSMVRFYTELSTVG